jgi:hypothetical protein
MRPSELDTRAVEALAPYARNSRTHSDAQIAQIAASISEFGFTNPVLIDADGGIIAGHGRVLAAKSLGLADVPVLVLDYLTETQRRAYVIADNKLALNAGWDEDVLRAEIEALGEGFDLDLLGFGDEELAAILNDHEPAADQTEKANGSLADRFGIAPFSVLNAREGWWQDRKRAWLSLGIRSEVGRGENLLQMSDTMLEPDPEKRAALKGKARTFGQDLMRGEHVVGAKTAPGLTWVGGARPADGLDETSQKILESGAGSGTSIFDPVLCELAYRWWSPPGGLVLDPFAGGSVRGIVASKTGRSYVGVDLRQEQVDANRAQGAEICQDGLMPDWICADSRTIDTLEVGPADMLFSCPPYADLEVYSDDPQDLSTLEYAEFRAAYFEIIAKSCALLKPDRFACFVVGDVRDPKGAYRNFVGDTVEAFRAAGLAYYNEAILVTACGSLALRAGKQFKATRKLGKTHQNVLVFLKGDAKRATKACGVPEFGEMTEATTDQPAGEQSDAMFGEAL